MSSIKLLFWLIKFLYFVLEDETGYIPLEFSCLRPTEEQLGLLSSPRRADYGYEMVEVVDAAFDISTVADGWTEEAQ